MSEENVEIVKRAAEAFNRSDFGAVREFCDPDLVFHEPPEQPAPRVLRGWEAAYEAWTAFDEAWEVHESRIEEVKPLPDGRVLVLSVERLCGRDGLEFEQPAGGIFTFRNGKITEQWAFWSRESALKAAGLQQ